MLLLEMAFWGAKGFAAESLKLLEFEFEFEFPFYVNIEFPFCKFIISNRNLFQNSIKFINLLLKNIL